ncbi:MAG: FadR family transcriptional regulator [Rhizobiales bacterium]|nr:FadR family transcriptional regulator [Hyphomicrobiales bacterium]
MTDVTSNKAKPRYLAGEVEQELRSLIENGKYQVGEKMPTENALGQQFKVSRTVIREAIAGLRAAGLVISRRGSGVFIEKTSVAEPGANLFLSTGGNRTREVIDTLELRSTVEVQSAYLAATRASYGQIEEILESHQRFSEEIAKLGKVENADFVFHEAIAKATNNEAFVQFLQHLGKRTIPRANLPMARDSQAYQDYMVKLENEHLVIANAISDRNADEAANAMKIHLQDSLARYRVLSRDKNKLK